MQNTEFENTIRLFPFSEIEYVKKYPVSVTFIYDMCFINYISKDNPVYVLKQENGSVLIKSNKMESLLKAMVAGERFANYWSEILEGINNAFNNDMFWNEKDIDMFLLSKKLTEELPNLKKDKIIKL